jgi:TonB family protein
LVEALTQQTPALQPGSQTDPAVPETLPQPFLDIVRHALRRDPRRRWTVGEIAARLNPVAVAAAAGQSVSPPAVPLSSAPAVPAVKSQAPIHHQPAPPRPQAQPPRQQAAKPAKQTLVLPNYVVPVAAGLFVIVAILALPKILGHRSDSSSSAATEAAQPAVPPKESEQPARRETKPATKAPAPAVTQNSVKAATEKKTASQPQISPVAAPTPTSVRTGSFPSANAASTAGSSSAHGEVLEQVLPDASAKALATIHGVVRVSVRAHVDPTGNVTEATLDSPGPSKYFADLALKAARRWEFTSPEVGGHSVPSEWVIRFHFTPSGPKAIPTQVSP